MQETTTQQVREQRSRRGGPVVYRYGAAEQGTARWLDVSRVGAKLRLGRYLRPGRQIELEFVSPLRAEERVRLSARVMWCRQVAGEAEFVAGVHVRRDAPEAAVAFAALSHSKQDIPEMMNTPAGSGVSTGVWPHFHALGNAGWEATAKVQQAV